MMRRQKDNQTIRQKERNFSLSFSLFVSRSKKGLTLIELIIYMGIVAIVLVTMIDLVTHLVYSQAKNSKNTEVQQNLGVAMERLTSSIENAKEASGTYPANTLNLTVSGSPVIYNLDGGVLTIQEAAEPAENLTNSKVVVSPPAGGEIFEKIINGTATTIKVNLVISLSSDPNTKQESTTTVLMRGK